MINRTLARRLEQLEAFVLPTDPPQQYIRLHSISPDGEGVDTRVLKVGEVQPPTVIAR